MSSVYTTTNSAGWCGYVDFTETVDTNNNKSTISWTGGLHNPNLTGTTQYYTEIKGIKLYIRVLGDVTLNGVRGGSNGTGLTIWVSPENVQKRVYVGGNGSNKTSLSSGSFTIGHASNGTASFEVAFVAWIYDGKSGFTEWRNHPSGSYDTISCQTIIRYSNPTAPTRFWVGATNHFDVENVTRYVPPLTTFTFVFSGATGGTNNPIKNYQIDWIVTSSDKSQRHIVQSSNVSSSGATLSPSGLSGYRGWRLSFQIRAIGSVDGYNSNYYESSDWYDINRLPAAPTGRSIVIKSTDTTGKLIVSPGNDGDSYQPLSIYYKKDSESDYKTFTGQSLPVGTYNFKTFDKLEYSSVSTFSITRNQKAKITVKGMIASKGTSSHSKFTKISNNVYYASSIQFTWVSISGNYDNIEVWFEYTTLPSSIPTVKPSFPSKVLAEVISSEAELTRKIFYPRNYIGTNVLYQIKLVPKYSLEDGEATELWQDTNTKLPLVIAPFPEEKGYYNNFDTKPKGEKNNVFWDKIRFCYSYDNTYDFSTVCGNEKLSFSKSTSPDKETVYYDVSVLTPLSSGASYTFKNTFTPIGGGSTKTYTNTLKEIKNIYSMSLQTSRDVIKPFTDTPDFSLYLTKFYEDGDDIQDYGFSNITSQEVTVALKINSTMYIISLAKENFIVGTDKIQIAIPTGQIYTSLESLTKTGVYMAELNVTLTNLFGKVYNYRLSSTITISYNEPVEVTFGKNNITATTPLKEKDNIVFTPEIFGYTNRNITYQIEISRDEKKTWAIYLSGSASMRDGEKSGRNLPCKYYSKDNTVGISISKEIQEISTKDNCYFRVVVDDGFGATKLYDAPFTRFRFIPVSFQLLSASVDDSKISLGYSVTDKGFDGNQTGSFSLSLQYNNQTPITLKENISLTSTDWENFLTGKLELSNKNVPEGEAGTCAISCAVKIGKVEKTSTQYIRYYVLQPTIAYRKNRLGINTKSIDNISDAVMVVRAPSETVKYIYFLGATDNPTGNEWNSVPFIDLENRTINNLIINGGSW